MIRQAIANRRRLSVGRVDGVTANAVDARGKRTPLPTLPPFQSTSPSPPISTSPLGRGLPQAPTGRAPSNGPHTAMAPLSEATQRYLRSLDMPLLEVFGMSESCGAAPVYNSVHLSRPHAFRTFL